MTPVRYHRNRYDLAFTLLFVAACQPGTPGEAESGPPATAQLAGDACGSGGRLTARLYGAIDADIDWTSGDMTCEGMPRPEGEGARLRFSGPLVDAGETFSVAFIMGIPDLAEGLTGRELPTNVTFVQEGAGRFFGTRDTDGCWTDIDQHELLTADRASYRIAGTVYCVSPLAELNGLASITFTELAFAGRINWELPE